MGSLFLIRKNLGRKKLRTTFTLMSIIIAFILFALLGALNKAFNAGLDLAGADRLVSMHRVSFIQPLPLSYVNRVSSIEGVSQVGHYTWFGAFFQDEKRQFGLFPTDLETLKKVYPEYLVPEDQWQALLKNRTGLLVGQALADVYGWKVGDRVPLGSTIYPQKQGGYSWEFDIVAIFDGSGNSSNEQQAFMHYDYFNESRQFGTDTIGWIVTKIEQPDQAELISSTIDDRFRNSPTETKTSGEKAWAASFAAQFGNIGLMVRAILACVFFTLLLVAGNTMAQSIRERTGELAVMKTLGFSDTHMMLMVLGESLLIAIIGALVGLFLAYGLVALASGALNQFFPGLDIPNSYLLWGLFFAVMLGLVTGAWPAWKAMQLKVVDALSRG